MPSLKRQGINVNGWDARTRWARKRLNSLLSVKARLAGTSAVEHYTAVIAEHIMKDKDFHHMIVDPTLKNLIYWHAMEESEHRAVAFDTHKAVGGTYAQRAVAMTIVSIGIGPVVLAAMLSLHETGRRTLQLEILVEIHRSVFRSQRAIPKDDSRFVEILQTGLSPHAGQYGCAHETLEGKALAGLIKKFERLIESELHFRQYQS